MSLDSEETTPANEVDWAEGLLQRLGKAPGGSNVVGVVAWCLAEGGHWHNDAHYNPLNTTFELQPCTSINSVGVKAYESWAQGYQATLQTLELSFYEGVRAALSSTDPSALAKAVGASPWGTGDFSAVIPRAYALVRGEEPGEADGGAPMHPQPVPEPTGAVPPPFDGRDLRVEEPYMEGSDVHTWQQRMAVRGWKIVVDGEYGPASEGVCRAFQQEKGLVVDGVVGPVTWNASWTAPITRP